MVNKYLNDQEQFKKMIIASVIFHASVFLVFTVKTLVFPTEQINYQAAIRVDLVGLPEKVKPEELSKPATKEVPKVEIKTEEKPKPESPKKVETSKKDKSKTLSEALQKLKKEKAIEDLKKMAEAAEKSNPQNTAGAETASKPIKGNVISPGTALRGLDKLQYNEYIGAIQLHVQGLWALPEWLARLDLKALAVVKIDKNGNVISKTLLQPSGNSEFDRRVILTIENASPFPIPPDKMQALVSVDGVVLAFPE